MKEAKIRKADELGGQRAYSGLMRAGRVVRAAEP